jgi:alcohol dehydrogenase (cytochrome c)
VAWSWSLPPGSSESTPLVHDGVMFVQGANDKVQALDARSGDLLWQYERRLPEGVAGSFKRGLALHGNRLYMGTSDVHVIALDVKTGTVIWDQVVGDPKVREQIGGGPLVAKGKVMMGTVGTGVGAKPGGPEIVGLDEETGRIAWRVHTIAQPGTPGGDSWNGVPVEKRSGASVWTPAATTRQRPRLLRHRQHLRHRPAREADRQAGRDERRALHRLDARDRSRHRAR